MQNPIVVVFLNLTVSMFCFTLHFPVFCTFVLLIHVHVRIKIYVFTKVQLVNIVIAFSLLLLTITAYKGKILKYFHRYTMYCYSGLCLKDTP